MQDNKVIPINERYRYNLFINQKAIWDFLVKNKTQHLITKASQTHLLGFLVAISKERNGIKTLTHENGFEYFLVQDKIILDNLKFLGVGTRQLKNLIRNLELSKTIDRWKVNDNLRYVRVNPELMELWHIKNWSMNASGYMYKHRPTLWEGIVNEWEPIHGSETFKEIIDRCNNEIDMQQIKYNDYDSIFKLFRNYLNKWKSKPPKFG
ncbi:hypothetical protein [uncultured Maribacter sp.]|uniref:hypothetical protein n=1 Tax=uncultured Maribacter sp. TaxID=431308 RepID=UPI0030D9067F|tara:strand:+ start:3762 stop:4385 length:624 start_codon:yes stop_codon:yes gene_type:complete